MSTFEFLIRTNLVDADVGPKLGRLRAEPMSDPAGLRRFRQIWARFRNKIGLYPQRVLGLMCGRARPEFGRIRRTLDPFWATFGRFRRKYPQSWSKLYYFRPQHNLGQIPSQIWRFRPGLPKTWSKLARLRQLPMPSKFGLDSAKFGRHRSDLAQVAEQLGPHPDNLRGPPSRKMVDKRSVRNVGHPGRNKCVYRTDQHTAAIQSSAW